MDEAPFPGSHTQRAPIKGQLSHQELVICGGRAGRGRGRTDWGCLMDHDITEGVKCSREQAELIKL